MADRPKGHVAEVVERNVRAVAEGQQSPRSREQRIADAVTAFAGSMWSVYLHLLVFGCWVLANSGALPHVEPWDPFPFGTLTLWASVEAIFLSTFVLISQNQLARLSDQRANLDLQVNLLAERKLTRLIALTDEIAVKLGAERPADEDELAAFKQDIAPEGVIDEIEAHAAELRAASGISPPAPAGEPERRRR